LKGPEFHSKKKVNCITDRIESERSGIVGQRVERMIGPTVRLIINIDPSGGETLEEGGAKAAEEKES